MSVSLSVREKVDGVREVAFRRQDAGGEYRLNCPLVCDFGAVRFCYDVADENALQKLGVIGSVRDGGLIVAACGDFNKFGKSIFIGLRLRGCSHHASHDKNKSFHLTASPLVRLIREFIPGWVAKSSVVPSHG